MQAKLVRAMAACVSQLPGDRAYALSFWLSAALCLVQLFSLPILVTSAGYWYARLAEILGTSRFVSEWDYLRTPLFPTLLKVSFWIFGRQALAVAVLQSAFGFGGIWLLGAALKGLGRQLEAAFVMPLLSFYPTLVSYEHSLLTEVGTFFFLAAILYVLTAPVRSPVRRAFELAGLITLGYYHRSSVLYVSTVVAAVYSVSLWSQGTISHRAQERTRLRRTAAVLIVGVLPFLLAFPWQRNRRVSERIGQSVLLYGLLKQGVLPLDDPILGSAAPLYHNAIHQSLVKNALPLTGVQEQLVYAPLVGLSSHTSDAGKVFAREIATHPRAYLAAFGRTLLLYSGFAAPETDSVTAIRAPVLTRPEATITARPAGFPPLDVDLTQRTGISLIARCLRLAAPAFDILLFLGAALTPLLLVFGLYRREPALLAFAAIPLSYLGLNALVLNSQDRMAVPVYPILLTNLVLLPSYLKPRTTEEPADADRLLNRLDRHAPTVLVVYILILAACHTSYALQSAMIPSSDEAHYMSGVLSIGRAIQSWSPAAVIQSFRAALGFKPPLICVPAALLYPIVSDVVLASKLSLIVLFIALGLSAYSLFRNLYSPALSAFAAALLITAPVVTGLTHRFYVEGMLLLISMVYLDLLIRDRIWRLRDAALLGAVAGLGLLAKTLFLPLILLPTSYTAFLFYCRDSTARKRPLALTGVISRLALLSGIAAAMAWTWYGYHSQWRRVIGIFSDSLQCSECIYPVVRAFLVNTSSGPYFFLFLLALAGLIPLGYRWFQGRMSTRETQTWVLILLTGLPIVAANAIGSNKTVRYTALTLPAVTALTVFTARSWYRQGRTLVYFLAAVTAFSTIMVLHNSFAILPLNLRWGDIRILDSRYPLNPPDWFDDNHPIDRRDFRIREATVLLARDAALHHPQGVDSRVGLLVHGLLINHDYLNLIAQMDRQPLHYDPFYMTETSGDAAPEYVLTCLGCGDVYPGRHWYNPHPDFLEEVNRGTAPYDQIFDLTAPASCRLVGFRKKHLLRQEVPDDLKPIPGSTPNFIDRLDPTLGSNPGSIIMSRQWPLNIAGWAIDAPSGSPAGAVYIEIDRKIFPTRYGLTRPDVAAALHNQQYTKVGFDAELPIGNLAAGRHSLAVRVLNARKTGYYRGEAVELYLK